MPLHSLDPLRTANINIRLTRLELAAIRAAASSTCFPTSTWARRVIIAALHEHQNNTMLAGAHKPRR